MFPIIDLNTARSRQWDVVIAGSSFASMFFLKGLPKDLSVLIVEKGSIQQISRTDRSAHTRYLEDVTQENTSGVNKRWVISRIFGGNSNFWSGQTPRFHPNDFSLKDSFGVGENWPIGYDDLEDFYQEVESTMEIAGGGSEHLLPRSRPFPFPPHAGSLTDRRLQEADPTWVPAPCARSNGGRRANCCANGVCFNCPVDAKFTIPNSIGEFEATNVHLLLDAEVLRLSIENGTASKAVLLAEGREVEVRGDLFALGAGAIHNPAILMRSDYEHPALGRYLHEQTSRSVLLDIGVPNFFGGAHITGHGYARYDGEFRSRYGAVLMENFNAPPVFRGEAGKWTQKMLLKMIGEVIPVADNHVSLDSEGAPVITWKGFGQYGIEATRLAAEALPDLLPFPVDDMSIGGVNFSESHVQGTTRMGSDPKASVVDSSLRCHELRNTVILGSSVFPSCSPANPTLTLSALSLRAARML